MQQLPRLLPFPQPGLPSSVFCSNQASLRVLINPLSIAHPVPKYPRKKGTEAPLALCPRSRTRVPLPSTPYPILPASPAERTPQRHNWPGAPAPAQPTHLRGSKGLRRKEGSADLTYDRELGAWAEILLIGTRKKSPALKPSRSSQRLPLASPVPALSSRAGRGPSARIQPALTPPPPVPPAARGQPADTHPPPSASCRPRRSGRRLQSTAPGRPTKIEARRPHSPSTRSRVPGPKYSVSESRPPSLAQKPSAHPPGPRGRPRSPSTDSRVPAPKY